MNKCLPPRDGVTELVEGVLCTASGSVWPRLCRQLQNGSGPLKPDGPYRSAEDGRIDKRAGGRGVHMNGWMPGTACKRPPTATL